MSVAIGDAGDRHGPDVTVGSSAWRRFGTPVPERCRLRPPAPLAPLALPRPRCPRFRARRLVPRVPTVSDGDPSLLMS